MNYEFRIHSLERELAHLREMQTIHRAHTDVHDTSFEAIGNRLGNIDANLDKLSSLQVVTEEKLQSLLTTQKATEQKLQSLIDLLLREHPNGHK